MIELAFQLLLALILGALLGTERTIAHKKAGLRTYGLVAMGSCLFVLTSTLALKEFQGISAMDLTRVISGIATGVGFLGTGVIIFKDTSLTGGLTTAAGLWVVAGIGVAVAFKFYFIAIVATLLTLLIFTILWFLEDRVKVIVDGE